MHDIESTSVIFPMMKETAYINRLNDRMFTLKAAKTNITRCCLVNLLFNNVLEKDSENKLKEHG
jgi:hypothetical protein